MTDEDKHRFKRQAHVANQALRLVAGFLAEHDDGSEPGVLFLVAGGLLHGLEAAGLPHDFVIQSVELAMSAVEIQMSKEPKP